MVILYTSGTTGFSKGVMLTYNNLMANIIFANGKFTFKEGDKILAFLPSAHAYGATFDFLYPFIRCNHIYFMSKIPSPKLLLKALEEVKPAVIEAVPLILEKIYHKNLKPVLEEKKMKMLLKIPGINQIVYRKINAKLINIFGGKLNEMIVGGAPMNTEVELFLRKVGFPVTIGYGMSECAPLISYERWHSRKIGSVGKAVDYLSVKIDSRDPATIPGEILIKGEQVMQGYYKNAEATNETFTADGWMRSGDIGVIDSDGFIFIRGRSKSIILGASGENIYPESLEFVLNNLTCIQESLVIQKDKKLIAMVYADMEDVDKLKLTEASLLQLMEENRKTANDHLPAYAKISEIKMVSEPFQKTPTQKIKRYLYQ
jgi:long-chain acyl-CoA synthetase